MYLNNSYNVIKLSVCLFDKYAVFFWTLILVFYVFFLNGNDAQFAQSIYLRFKVRCAGTFGCSVEDNVRKLHFWQILLFGQRKAGWRFFLCFWQVALEKHKIRKCCWHQPILMLSYMTTVLHLLTSGRCCTWNSVVTWGHKTKARRQRGYWVCVCVGGGIGSTRSQEK